MLRTIFCAIPLIRDFEVRRSAISKKLLCNDKWTTCIIQDIAEIGRGRVISSVEIDRQKHPLYPVYSSQTSNNGIMGYLDNYMFDGEYITWTTDGANAGTVFYRKGKFNCTNVCGTLKILPKFDCYFVSLVLAENGGYPPTQNGDIRSLFWLFSLMALQN